MQQGGSPIDDAVYDFVYSMGLFDYLTDTTATAVLSWLYGRLLPPQPLLAALTGGRRGPAAFWTRLRTLALR